MLNVVSSDHCLFPFSAVSGQVLTGKSKVCGLISESVTLCTKRFQRWLKSGVCWPTTPLVPAPRSAEARCSSMLDCPWWCLITCSQREGCTCALLNLQKSQEDKALRKPGLPDAGGFYTPVLCPNRERHINTSAEQEMEPPCVAHDRSAWIIQALLRFPFVSRELSMPKTAP